MILKIIEGFFILTGGIFYAEYILPKIFHIK